MQITGTAAFVQLRELRMRSHAQDRLALAPLASLVYLVKLMLLGRQVTNPQVDLAPLKNLTELQHLKVQSLSVDDGDLTPLNKLTKLKELDLRLTNVSRAASAVRHLVVDDEWECASGAAVPKPRNTPAAWATK